MKPIRIVLSPTRSRPVNIFLGLVLLLLSTLALLALATYHASDPSLNTATDAVGPHAVHNWIGLFGAYLSDLLLQSLGITAFFLPLWLTGIGWTWMRSRPSGPAALRIIGLLLVLVFVPAVFGLMPWSLRWLHLIPAEGVVGRLMAGMLVGYLNIQGAWLVTSVLAATGLYFASAISWSALWEVILDRWQALTSAMERRRDLREERLEERAEAEEGVPSNQEQLLIAHAEPDSAFGTPIEKPRRFGLFFMRR